MLLGYAIFFSICYCFVLDSCSEMGVPESPLNSRRDLKVFDLIANFPFTYNFKQMLGYYIKKALGESPKMRIKSLYLYHGYFARVNI